jgi:S1/P1 Nuclease
MVIAAVAFKQLSPDQQKRVTAILKAHPDYAKWQASYPKYGDGMELPLFIFMRASTWPDEIRRGGGAESKYDRPHWHYVDWPLRPPSFPLGDEPAPTDNVIYGISQCEKVLGDTNSTAEDKAANLSCLIHFVGDIHQPLHCVSLFSAAYPNGDKGGNDFYVMPGTKSIKLHAFWDQLLGSRINERTSLNDAVRIVAEHPKKDLPELTTDTTPKSWSSEGRELAIDKVYLHGDLKGSTSADTAPALPDGYTRGAKAVAEKQAALAGYRLADEIGRFLD